MYIVALLLLLFGAVISDLVSEKIPNFIILSGLVTGIFYRFVICGETRVDKVILDILLPFFLFFVFFAVKAIGAGDIKLLMVTGLYLGSGKNLWCMFLALSIAAVIGLVRLILGHKLLSRFGSLLRYIKSMAHNNFLRSGETVPYLSGERLEKTGKIHFSLPILFGATIAGFFIKG